MRNFLYLTPMSNIFPPPLVKRLNEEFHFEDKPYFDSDEPSKAALIIVDLQNDFLPKGSLAVPRGDEIIPVVNNLQKHYDLIIATQDWHPAAHKSFASNHPDKEVMETIILDGREQVLWPDHCVQGTKGAELVETLESNKIELIVRKGTDVQIDSYSAFFDNGHKKSTGLAGYLIEKGISKLAVCGLAADYCVFYTAMDALELGFEVEIITEGTRAIDPETFAKKIELFKEKGGTVSS